MEENVSLIQVHTAMSVTVLTVTLEETAHKVSRNTLIYDHDDGDDDDNGGGGGGDDYDDDDDGGGGSGSGGGGGGAG